MNRRFQIVNGKLVKPKQYKHIEPKNEKINTHSVTRTEEEFVNDRPPEVQVIGQGISYRTFSKPVNSVRHQTEMVTKKANPDIVSGLGLLKFNTPSMRNTKSKNIKIII